MNASLTRRSALRILPLLVLARTRASGAAPRDIHMVARRFVFEPSTVVVQRGQPVTLHLTAPEVPMGFSLPDFHLRTDIVPGREAVIQLTPDKAGEFEFVCDVFCGDGHENMSGTLSVRA
jgi:cytochrome c oxidase subunit 2